MKNWLGVASVVAVLALGPIASAEEKPAAPENKEAPKAAQAASGLATQKDKVSYSIGMDLGRNLGRTVKQFDLDLDVDVLVRGLKDSLASTTTLTEEEARQVMTTFGQEVQSKMGDKNKKEGEAFLAENAKKEGVKTLPSGLQYKVLKDSTGKSPLASDTVTVHYKGTLINGTVFDSSEGREPASFPVNRVIPGWTEALQLMKVGAKWQLFIPAKLAYGETGNMGIAPNSTLLFDVELLKIEDAAKVAEGEPKAAK